MLAWLKTSVVWTGQFTLTLTGTFQARKPLPWLSQINPLALASYDAAGSIAGQLCLLAMVTGLMRAGEGHQARALPRILRLLAVAGLLMG
ncbi:hypothetical protein [Thermogemmatispora sp.]|uniref:hypothetical protein n=1 Tax=Thermogemmatispora sp. TaxID=1968838 RepID=UPI0035E42B2E